ncbi:hypothetical protein EYF80_015418 [Liparis tanakae]|uniref:Uncharacterized protein n=1 Tax=Liparis tanakae TaxID=230148 RepID=A0A4Z2IAA8_9TELE|nr:hypothetical protein EYF80_015418 [Liparis tanakae]
MSEIHLASAAWPDGSECFLSHKAAAVLTGTLLQPAVKSGRVFLLQTLSCLLKVILLNLERSSDARHKKGLARRPKALGEGAHHNVHVSGVDVEQLGHSPPRWSHCSDTVGLIQSAVGEEKRDIENDGGRLQHGWQRARESGGMQGAEGKGEELSLSLL